MGKPTIRFEGYTDDWEQRKLIEVCDYVDYRGKTPTKTEDGIFLVTAKNVKDGFIDYETSKEYISENAYEEVMRRGKPEIGDVLITTEAPCGNVAQVNKADIALAQRIIKYRGYIGVVDNTYLKYYLLSPEFQKILNAKSSGGTVQGIKGSILHQQKIIYPSYEEQKKIGQHMDSLDTLITLHHRKCEETKKLKKFMLQKMFPKKGEKVPDIRFDGFTDDWEQRKFGDLADYKKGPFGSAITKDMFVPKSEESIKVYEQQNAINKDWKLERYFLPKEYALTKLKSFEVHGGDIIVSCAGTIGEIYEIPENADTGVINQALMRVRVDEDCVDKRMFKIAFSNMIDDFTRVHSNGSAIKNIPPFSDLKPMGVLLPSLQEQEKISSYFEKLDNLITLHQRKCEELQNIKKFMLQNMFT